MESKGGMILALVMGIVMTLRSIQMLHQGTEELAWYISGLVVGSGLVFLSAGFLIGGKLKS